MEREIFFNEEFHKYTDQYNNTFTSVTTVIGKYTEKFDTIKMADICAKIGKNPSHPKYLKYKGKTAKQLTKEWEDETIRACTEGSNKHNYLEDVIKQSNNYKRVKGKFINDRIFTVPDIKQHPDVGIVTLERLVELGLDSKYPIIFNTIKGFIELGWKLYAEIGVYSADHLVSGLIDLLLVKGDKIFILDWKTNKAPISFDSGYYAKDLKGNLMLDNYILDGKTFLYPLSHLPASVGHKYSMQLSTYAYLCERFGYQLSGILLAHIRTIDGIEQVSLLKMDYLKNDVELMLNHHVSNQVLNNQTKLFV
jgi:hypothetical protein